MQFLSSRKIVTKKKTSAENSYIFKSAKKVETITCRKVLNYFLAFDEESKRKLLNLISAVLLLEIIMYMTLPNVHP